MFNENSSPYYPGDPVLQAALVSQAATVPGLQTSYPSRNVNGVTGIVNARAEYSITPSLKVGGRASFQRWLRRSTRLPVLRRETRYCAGSAIAWRE